MVWRLGVNLPKPIYKKFLLSFDVFFWTFLPLQMLYAERVSSIMFDVSCMNAPSNICDFFSPKLIQSTSMRPDFLRLEIIMSRLQDWISLYTDVVLFFFSFFSKTSASSRERKIYLLFSSSPTTTPLRWWSINPPRFMFYHARSTDFEEKVEGPWTG